MTSCPEVDLIEDLVLGLLSSGEARELSVHLAACATCRGERTAFEAERALFVARAPLVVAPELERPQAAGRGHGPGAFVALACAAAVALAGNVAALRVDTSAAPAPREPLASYVPSEPTLCDDDPAMRAHAIEPAASIERPVCEERVTSAVVGP